MRTITSAPKNTDAFERYGYLLNVAKTGISIGIVLGVLIEALPVHTILQNNITQYIAPILGNMADPLTIALTIVVLYTLAKESVSSGRAAWGTLNKDTQRDLGVSAIAVIWAFFIFVTISRATLTVIGTHQITEAAIKAPEIEDFDDEPELVNIAESAAAMEAAKAQGDAIKAVRNAAKGSESAVKRKIKAAKTEWSKNQLKKELTQLQDENAIKIKEAKADSAVAIARLVSVMTAQNNVRDSINNANRGVIVALNKNKAERYFWVSGKIQRYFPILSFFSILFVAACTYVVVVVENKCGIEHKQVPDKYEYLPNIASVYTQAIKNAIEGHLRNLATKIQAPEIVGSDGKIHAGAAGISRAIAPQYGDMGQQDATIHLPPSMSAPPPQPSATLPPVIPPSDQLLDDDDDDKKTPPEQGGRKITLSQAYGRRNTYQNFIDNQTQGRDLVLAAARVRYYQALIDHMIANNTTNTIAPPFKLFEWTL